MIFYRTKGGFKVAELWYDPLEKPAKKVDVLRCRFVPTVAKNAFSVEEKYTLVTDLSKPQEELFSRIHKNTRYEINRAQGRDGIDCFTFFEPQEQHGEAGMDKENKRKLLQYVEFFNGFAASKRRTPVDPGEFDQFCSAGALYIRCAAKDSQPVVMHAYIVSDGIARLHQSASHFRDREDQESRNLTGRANRLLHWDDMLYFKNRGILFYDYGGVYGGHTDREKLAIAQFKLAFGGVKKREYIYIVPVSAAGYFSVFLHAIHRLAEKSVWALKRFLFR
ncbi:MAG: hypothetical protein LBO65_04210 [Spirochaetaceae bacterium]|jgi:hypothetical protein|nr:hypothetical protein [Spirochaetaceae bacterium]